MTTNMMCNSTKFYGEAISYLYQENNKLKIDIERNRSRIEKKMDANEVKHRIETLEKKLNSKVNFY